MCETISSDCVMIKNAYLSSKNEDILVDVNMRVAGATIYGLLGPSGCGKTTLLRCVVGLIFPQYGEVKVCGHTPGESESQGQDVGYMPQETALYETLTIKETLFYFGKIHFLSNKALRLRVEQLIQILELPEKYRVVSSLSGGQRRRVSFAVTLIHNPSLIILDEPTSGVDPLLREKIWQMLIALTTQQKTTIILTTQYIEETRRAHRVGFMRKGRIIVEDSPQSLLNSYSTKTLEEAFLKICTNRKNNSVKSVAKEKVLFKRKSNLFKLSKNWRRNFYNWFFILFTLLWKNFIRNLRDPMTICFQFVLPISQVTLFAFCIGARPHGINVGLVNEDLYNDFTSQFLDEIDPSVIRVQNFSDYNTAIASVRNRDIWAVIRIGQNFSENIYQRRSFFEDVDDDIINSGMITVHADLTDKIISLSMMRHLFNAFVSFSRKVLIEIGVNPQLAQLPIQVEDAIYGKYDKNSYHGFRDFMIPGLIVNITFAIAYSLTALALITERNGQTFERNFVSGISCTQILIAHALSRIAFMLPYVFVITYLPIAFFHLPSVGETIYGIALLLLLNLTGMSYGIVIAAICKKLEMAIILAAGTLFLLLFASGAIWPLQAVPTWFKWFSYSTPTALPTESLRMILFLGWDIYNKQVLLGYGVASLWIIILFSVGLKSFRYNK